MDKHSGRQSQLPRQRGQSNHMPYKGDVASTVEEIPRRRTLYLTYVGARRLKDLSNAPFLRVTQQVNTSLNAYEA